MKHPARYALVELVNLHDEALTFEPIDRVVFGCDFRHMIQAMEKFFTAQGSTFSVSECTSEDEFKAIPERIAGTHRISYVTKDFRGTITIKNPKHSLEVGSLQLFLDEYIKGSQIKIDYIHGEEIVIGLGIKRGNAGFFLPAIDKFDFFRTIVKDGVLPRKTFSMGHADEKRFYLECRRITE